MVLGTWTTAIRRSSGGRWSWNILNLLAVLRVSSPPIETRASTPRELRAPGARCWKRGGALGVGQVAGVRHILAGIGPGRADHDPSGVPRPPELVLVQDDVITPFLHRVIGAVFHEMGIAVEDAQDLDAVAEERGRGRGDDRVGRRSGSAGEEDGDAADLARIGRRQAKARRTFSTPVKDLSFVKRITNLAGARSERDSHGATTALPAGPSHGGTACDPRCSGAVQFLEPALDLGFEAVDRSLAAAPGDRGNPPLRRRSGDGAADRRRRSESPAGLRAGQVGGQGRVRLRQGSPRPARAARS